MAASINASSISNGIVASGDASGILALQGNGTTGLTINASGKLVVPNIALGTASAGMLEYDGTTHYFTPSGTQRGIVPGQQFYMLNSAYTGSNATGAQSIFGLTNGVSVSSNTVYVFECSLYFGKSAGTTSSAMSITFGGTATLNSILYQGISNQGGSALTGAVQATPNSFIGNSATNPVQIASTNATEYIQVAFRGTVSVNAGGTFNPQYALSAAPGGAYTTAAGSYFSIYPIGAAGSNINVGTWS
jgi:hypothetical protein